jgi:hypothetical protein
MLRRLKDIVFYLKIQSQVLVAHGCNPSYSGGRDQEDHGSKPRSLKKILHKKRAGSSCKLQVQTPALQKKEKIQIKIHEFRVGVT